MHYQWLQNSYFATIYSFEVHAKIDKEVNRYCWRNSFKDVINECYILTLDIRFDKVSKFFIRKLFIEFLLLFLIYLIWKVRWHCEQVSDIFCNYFDLFFWWSLK